ncbi:centrosomal protein of 170 kDa protein B [Aplysia californica]|uniref:Centrosomal protein of 170 kDa protein B n=1 Tax=Aplysia californica TaxID=6500 RepID=A0ABM1A067_APLCA|nr:centrosomal protein of 170 kDa protein B [Aplysia californica]
MDRIRQKAQSLLEKLQEKYGVQSRHPVHLVVAIAAKEGEGPAVQDHWYLVDTHGQKFRLPKTMLFLGREECDVIVASQSVDKRHAVLTFDLYLNRFKVKDLSTTNGTFVNNSRIPEQEYVTLNHMDSIRLGYDAMMYHMEQGSQITNQGGQLPDPHVVPSWATRHAPDPTTIHVHAHTHGGHTMAECQGCIAEQSIEHSCGLKTENKPLEDDVWIHDPNHHLYHQQQHHCHTHDQLHLQQPPPHLLHHHHRHSPQQSQQCAKHSQGYHTTQPTEQADQSQQQQQQHQKHCSSPSQQQQQQQLRQRQSPRTPTAGELSESNTPRASPAAVGKSSRTPPHLTPQNSWNREEQEGGDAAQRCGDGADQPDLDDPTSGMAGGLGRNTWPRKRVRQMAHVGQIFSPEAGVCGSNPDGQPGSANSSEARPAGNMGGMYFVSFDDSVCNGSTGSGNVDCTGDHAARMSRNKRNTLPPELATVKKGTPLYGQPSWWGEDEDEATPASNSANKRDSEKKDTGGKRSRPNSLTLSSEGLTTSPGAANTSGMDGDKKDTPRRTGSATYMEIPIRDEGETPEGLDERSRDTVTPAKSISSSLSKDSLFSPDVKGAKGGKAVSPGSEVNPATSFTVDLGDHPPRKININTSLSEFVPPKMRKNFRDRKDRVVSSRTSSSKESTPSKNSEERELSPGHQRKIEEMWSAVESKAAKPGSRLSSVQATLGSSSLRSPNLEDIDRLSEFSEERKSTEREADKKGQRPVSSKSPQTSKSGGRRRTSPSGTPSDPSSSSSAAKSPVSHAQYSDPTSYLIDKMFEGGHSSSPASSKEMSPEQRLYREAAGHDRPKTGGSKPTKASAAGGGASSRKNDLKTSQTKTSTAKTSNTKTPHAKISNAKTPPRTKTSQKTVAIDDDLVDDEEDVEEDDLRITEGVADKGREDKEDKASEAGTYTIEADKEDEVEEEARKRIDQVFGVDVDSFVDRPIIDPQRMASPGGYDNVREDTEGDKTPQDEINNFSSVFGAERDDKDNDADDNDDDLLLGDDDEDRPESPGMATADGVQTWVSQLTALTSHKSAAMAADAGKLTRDEGGTSLSKKPPQGISRKRPGTGRKLPSIPTDRSPVSSEHSSYMGDHSIDLHIADDPSSPSRSSDLLVNGKNGTHKAPVRISSQQAGSRGRSNGYSTDPQDGVSPASTSRSRGSVDTELLLQDTETVMAAMEARMAHKSHGDGSSPGHDSDTDVSSTVALVNGDEDYVKPTLYKSPRDALSKRRNSKDGPGRPAGGSVVSSTPPVSGGGGGAGAKRGVGRSYSQTVASKAKTLASPRSGTSVSIAKKSVVSDVYSRADSVDNESIISDVSSDTGDGNLSRSSSKGKGNITMTKPNRAFQLRRARADSFDEPTTPRSGKSTGRTGASGGASARSSSVHSAPRRTAPDSHRSEATSLGGQIVKKSRENAGQEKAKSSNNLSRADGGRHSLRLQRASSLTIAQAAAASSPNAAARRETTPKSMGKSSGASNSRGNLSVTGVSSTSLSSRSQSQPGSRSNSPKAAERMAWKRRKEYDPRRAVAEAKAKAKEGGSSSSTISAGSVGYGVTARPKPSASSNYKRRMIRSASFTNSAELQLSAQNALSGSQDFVTADRRDYEHDGFRRAFLPFHSSLRTDRSAYSADEDDSMLSANSTQDSTRSLMSLHVNSQPKSAFTPPLVRGKAVSSPDSPPSHSSLLLRRRTIHTDGEQQPPLENGASTARSSASESPAQASYDTLIVTSIYQLSLKLATATDKSMNKLREQDRVSLTPSPIDDFLSDSGKSEITAFKSANQELAGVLKNLRKIKRHVQVMDRVLFPDEDNDTDISSGLRIGQHYVQEIERIRNEIKGFQPIEPHDQEVASPEMAELSEQF